MSEPIRTSAAKHKQLAAALKRNMARRKAVGNRESPVVGEAGPTYAMGEDEKCPPRFSGEGIAAQPMPASARKGTPA